VILNISKGNIFLTIRKWCFCLEKRFELANPGYC